MIRLDKFEAGDYETLISWVDSAKTLMQFAGPAFTFPLTRDQIASSLNELGRYSFKATEIQSGKMIGYGEIYLKKRNAHLGRIIIGEKEYTDKGYGHALVTRLVEYAFEKLNQSEIELNVFDWNVAAIKCYSKAGFIFDHYKKSERRINGKTWIVLNMVLQKK